MTVQVVSPLKECYKLFKSLIWLRLWKQCGYELRASQCLGTIVSPVARPASIHNSQQA